MPSPFSPSLIPPLVVRKMLQLADIEMGNGLIYIARQEIVNYQEISGEMTMQEKLPMPITSSFSLEGELPLQDGIPNLNVLQGVVDRRISRRYRVKGRLLAVCEFYSGEILDISRSGFSYKIAHIRTEEEAIPPVVNPNPSRIIDIFSPDLCRHLIIDLNIDEVFDLYAGPLYADNQRILQYRRGVRLAADLTEDQMKNLLPYFAGAPEDETYVTRGERYA